jgi:hypothetical protein
MQQPRPNPADLTVTLVELLASVGDVLTYYQERLANESYLCEAHTRVSVRQRRERRRRIGRRLLILASLVVPLGLWLRHRQQCPEVQMPGSSKPR